MEGCLHSLLLLVIIARCWSQIQVPLKQEQDVAAVDVVHSSLSMVELEKEVKVMKAEIQALKQGKQNKTTGVAFTARRTFTTTMGQNQIVRFNRIDLNLGRAYDGNTGIFTCPHSGLYFFHFSFVNGIGKATVLSLIHNGISSISAATYAPTTSPYIVQHQVQASNGRFLLCTEGGKVWVKNTGTDDRAYDSTFSGVLVY